MKKSILSVAIALGISSVYAQDLTSKKGEPFLPEANDWAISVDASPFLNYAGRMLSTTGSTSPTVGYTNTNFMIMGKMFKDEKTAYRVKLRLGMNSSSQKTNIADASNTSAVTFPNLAPVVEDKAKSRTTFFGVGVGLEKRRGKTRLQGFYGGEGMIGLTSGSAKFEYGNDYSTTATNTQAISTNYTVSVGNSSVGNLNAPYGGRILTYKQKMGFGLGVRGFIGAEYFIFPKMSIGGEFGWGIGFSTGGKTKTTSEAWDGTSQAKGETEVENPGSSSFIIDTDINNSVLGGGSAQLTLNLHF
ncbi:MAG: hypothetical protein J0M08_12625 [Bacteroidetes bacterium]|nr:hypothetical protein [Bacteroidota bacterium]